MWLFNRKPRKKPKKAKSFHGKRKLEFPDRENDTETTFTDTLNLRYAPKDYVDPFEDDEDHDV